MTKLAGVVPVDTKAWFSKEISGRTYRMRVVRYHSVYVTSAIDLGLRLDTDTGQYDFDGLLSFTNEDGNALLGGTNVPPEQVEWKEEGDGTVVTGGRSYLNVRSGVDRLGLLYLMPFLGVQGAVRPLELVLVICKASCW